MNRRQVLYSFICMTGASAFARSADAVSKVPVIVVSSETSSCGTLPELLQETVDYCCHLNSELRHAAGTESNILRQQSVRTGQLCRIAIGRLQNSASQSPAFWQVCADCVARMEVEVLQAPSQTDHATPEFAATLQRLHIRLSEHNAVVIEQCTLRN